MFNATHAAICKPSPLLSIAPPAAPFSGTHRPRPLLQHRLMAPPNTTWAQILAQAEASPEVLKQQEVVRSIQNVLQTNVSVCTSLGQPFVVQFNIIFKNMLQVYRLYSELISQAIATGGANAAR